VKGRGERPVVEQVPPNQRPIFILDPIPVVTQMRVNQVRTGHRHPQDHHCADYYAPHHQKPDHKSVSLNPAIFINERSRPVFSG
jgi:hypothetical protein